MAVTNGIIKTIKKYALPVVVATLILLYVFYNQLLDLLLGEFSAEAFPFVFLSLLVIAVTTVVVSVAFSTYIMKEHTEDVESTIDGKIAQFQSNVNSEINTLQSAMEGRIDHLVHNLANQLRTDRRRLNSQFKALEELNRKMYADKSSEILMFEQLNKLRQEGNVMNTNELIAFEKKMIQRKKCEIWVLTMFLEIERKPDMKSAIVDNLLKGHSYTYLIPNGNKKEFHSRVNEWFDMAKTKNNSLQKSTFLKGIKCILVPEHFPYMTIVIYNARSPRPEVVIKFPYREGGGKVDELFERWMFKVTAGEDAFRIRNALKELIDSTVGKEHICDNTKVFNLENVGELA